MAKLAEAMTASQTELQFVSVETFPTQGGIVKVDNEYIKYANSESSGLTHLTRGWLGSTAATHVKDSLVSYVSSSDSNTIVRSKTLVSPASISVDDVSSNEILHVTTVMADALVLTLPKVSDLSKKTLTVEHVGAGSLSVEGVNVLTNEAIEFVFNGSTWSAEKDLSGGGSSVTPSVQVTTTNAASDTTGTYTVTGLTSSFALSDASHKVKITALGDLRANGAASYAQGTIFMDATDLDPTGNGLVADGPLNAGDTWGYSNICMSILASPGDTNSHTYAVYVKEAGTGTSSWNDNQATSVLILEEIV